MPGLFGIMRKDPRAAGTSLQTLARRMADSMRHTPWLKAELWGDEVFWGGRVHFESRPPADLPAAAGSRVRAWLHGQLFVRGAAASDAPGAAAASRLISEPAAWLRDADGSFGLAVYDTQTRTLILATDRLGFRPLFWTETVEWFAYASEVKALLAVVPRQPDLDEVSLRQFFGYDHMLGDRTWWRGITLVPPASYWQVSAYGSTRRCYWTFDEIRRDLRDENEVPEAFASLWADEVRRYSRVGTTPLLLSGGQDSRFLLAEMRAQHADVVAITVGATDSVEIRPARQAARVAGVPHRIVHLGPDNWWHRREEAIWLTDGLVSCFHLNFAAAMDEVRTGNGYVPMNVIGDLLFGGSHLTRDLQHVDWRGSPSHLLGPRYVVDNPFFARDEVIESAVPEAVNYAAAPSSDCFYIHQRIRRSNLTSHHCLSSHCEFGFPGTGIALLELFLGALSDEQRRGHRFYNQFLLMQYPRYFAGIPWQVSRRGLRESVARRLHWRLSQRFSRLAGRDWRPKRIRADQWFVDYPECLRHGRIRERLAQAELLADEFLNGRAHRVLGDPHGYPLSTQVLLSILTFEHYLRQVAGMPSPWAVPGEPVGVRAG